MKSSVGTSTAWIGSSPIVTAVEGVSASGEVALEASVDSASVPVDGVTELW